MDSAMVLHGRLNWQAELLFRLARWRLRDERQGAADAVTTVESYSQWRAEELRSQFYAHFSIDAVRDNDVLDFGCGAGELALSLAPLGPRRMHGIDLSAALIALARSAGARSLATFQHNAALDRIELPDHSFDVILCFDVLEHIMDYRAIIREWGRVLRPGGRVLIWWQPWFHPYGHHVASYLPLPWIHAVFGDATLQRACAKVVDLPSFKVPHWDRDAAGNKVNRFARMDVDDDLNHLTIRGFEAICRNNGYRFLRRDYRPFRAVKGIPILRHLPKLPVLREFLTAYVIYDIAVS